MIRVGDLIIDYMKGRKCIIGVAEVAEPELSPTGARNQRSPVRYDNDYELAGEKFPLYVKVKPLVINEGGLSVENILSKLSISKRLKGPNKWGRFFSSAQRWNQTDGEIILEALQRLTGNS